MLNTHVQKKVLTDLFPDMTWQVKSHRSFLPFNFTLIENALWIQYIHVLYNAELPLPPTAVNMKNKIPLS